MDLSPEERKKIYEEEKARIEAEAKQAGEGAPTTGLESNVAGLLCYLGIWVSGLIFLLLEQKNRFVRFHAIQSCIIFGFLAVAGTILNQISFWGWSPGIVIWIITFVFWIVLMVKAYHGELYKVPLAGDLAEKISGVSAVAGGAVPQKDGDFPQPSAEQPSVPPAGADRRVVSEADGARKKARMGRLTASSFTIAWSLLLLVFFNIFYRYIAYYQLEDVGGITRWAQYPILTGAFTAWLPLLNTALILTLVGHILLIIYDNFVLRETTLIILNLFGIAVVATLLSLFPFDFSQIPNATAGMMAPVIVTVVLVCVIVGLGIATLVSFVKLIINVAGGNISY